MANSREQRRLLHLTGQLSAGGEWRAVTICNVSSRGLMGKCAEPPATGLDVEVRHHGFSLAGRVAWSQGERFGMVCAAPIDLAALQGGTPEVRVGRRSLPRTTVRVPGELVLRDNVFAVLLVDISQTGARVHLPAPPRAGARAVLSWADQEHPCTVLWAKNDAFGVEFDQVLSGSVVAALRAGARRRRNRQELQPVWPKPQIPAYLQPAPILARRAVRDHGPPRRGDALSRRVRG